MRKSRTWGMILRSTNERNLRGNLLRPRGGRAFGLFNENVWGERFFKIRQILEESPDIGSKLRLFQDLHEADLLSQTLWKGDLKHLSRLRCSKRDDSISLIWPISSSDLSDEEKAEIYEKDMDLNLFFGKNLSEQEHSLARQVASELEAKSCLISEEGGFLRELQDSSLSDVENNKNLWSIGCNLDYRFREIISRFTESILRQENWDQDLVNTVINERVNLIEGIDEEDGRALVDLMSEEAFKMGLSFEAQSSKNDQRGRRQGFSDSYTLHRLKDREYMKKFLSGSTNDEGKEELVAMPTSINFLLLEDEREHPVFEILRRRALSSNLIWGDFYQSQGRLVYRDFESLDEDPQERDENDKAFLEEILPHEDSYLSYWICHKKINTILANFMYQNLLLNSGKIGKLRLRMDTEGHFRTWLYILRRELEERNEEPRQIDVFWKNAAGKVFLEPNQKFQPRRKRDQAEILLSLMPLVVHMNESKDLEDSKRKALMIDFLRMLDNFENQEKKWIWGYVLADSIKEFLNQEDLNHTKLEFNVYRIRNELNFLLDLYSRLDLRELDLVEARPINREELLISNLKSRQSEGSSMLSDIFRYLSRSEGFQRPEVRVSKDPGDSEADRAYEVELALSQKDSEDHDHPQNQSLETPDSSQESQAIVVESEVPETMDVEGETLEVSQTMDVEGPRETQPENADLREGSDIGENDIEREGVRATENDLDNLFESETSEQNEDFASNLHVEPLNLNEAMRNRSNLRRPDLDQRASDQKGGKRDGLGSFLLPALIHPSISLLTFLIYRCLNLPQGYFRTLKRFFEFYSFHLLILALTLILIISIFLL